MSNIIEEAEKDCIQKSPEELADMVGEVGIFWGGNGLGHISISELQTITEVKHGIAFSDGGGEVYKYFKPFSDSDTGYLVCALRKLL